MEQGKMEPEKEPGNLVLLLIRLTVRNFSWCQTGLYKIRLSSISLCVAMRNFNSVCLGVYWSLKWVPTKKLRKQKKRSYPEWKQVSSRQDFSQNPHRARGFVKSPLLLIAYSRTRPTSIAHTLGSSLWQMQGPGWSCLCLGISLLSLPVLATCPTGSVTWVLRKRRDLTEIQVKCQQCPCPSLATVFISKVSPIEGTWVQSCSPLGWGHPGKTCHLSTYTISSVLPVGPAKP